VITVRGGVNATSQDTRAGAGPAAGAATTRTDRLFSPWWRLAALNGELQRCQRLELRTVHDLAVCDLGEAHRL
jgi:hypothetical protein